MSSFSLPCVQSVENSQDDCMDMPLLELEASQGRNNSEPAPRVVLTLSNPLVQFLSPLQLQGYAPRLIESFGVHRMDELAARVKCEDDVDILLGSLASLQQRQEFWKGICKWKRAMGKRGREPAKRSDKKKKVAVSGNVLDSEAVLQSAQEIATERIKDLDNCTPSQFMHQFAFRGYRDGVLGLRKQQVEESYERNVAALVKADEDGEIEAAVQMVSTPRRSTSWNSSLSSMCETLFHSEKRFRREKIPLSTLSMGLEIDIVGTDEFVSEWASPCDGAVRPHDRVFSIPTPELRHYTQSLEEIEQCCAEFEALKGTMCEEVQKAVAEYNEGLKRIQEKLHLLLTGVKDSLRSSRDSALFEKAAGLCSECQLRAELHPAKSRESGIVFLITQGCGQGVDSICRANKTCSCPSAHESGLLRELPTNGVLNGERMGISQLASMTIVSPPSGSLVEDVIPSLSDITSPGRGSQRYTPTMTLQGKMMQRSAPPHDHSEVTPNFAVNGRGHTLPAAFLFDGAGAVSVPIVRREENIVQVPTAAGEDDDCVEEQLLPCPGTATLTSLAVNNNSTECACLVDTETGDAFFLDHFGLKALGDEDSAVSASQRWGSAPQDYTMLTHNEKAKKVVESQVIDVEILSSSHCDTEETNTVLTDAEVSCVIPVENSIDQRTTCSSPMVLKELSSQNGHDWVCTRLSRQRQRAVSRSSSVSPLQESGGSQGDFFPLRGRVTALDWTEASSIVVDLRHLASKLREGEEKPGEMDIAEDAVTDQNLTFDSATAVVSSVCQMLPQGLPPLPARNSLNTTLFDCDGEMSEALEQLTSEKVMNMDYSELRKWCMQLGLRVTREESCVKDAEDLEASVTATRDASGQGDSYELTRMQGENSNGWWLHDGGSSGDISDDDLSTAQSALFSPALHRQTSSEECSTTALSLPMMNGVESEWGDLRRAALTEQMRETLRLFIARRTFMQQVVPAFFHRLPRFSGGPPYKPVRAADLVKAHLALTREELEEQRCLAKKKEAEEVTCCVITSLAAEAAEGMERQALSAMTGKGTVNTHSDNYLSTSTRGASPKTIYNEVHPGLSVYEEILLMEPADVQAVVALVQADFPHVSRHRVETLLEESGIPLDLSRRVCGRRDDGNDDPNWTQRSTPSRSPPPSSLTHPEQTGQTEKPGQSKRHFFAQRHWMRRRRER